MQREAGYEAGDVKRFVSAGEGVDRVPGDGVEARGRSRLRRV